MPVHITARLAWHDAGWNGSVCSKPERNTYCVGCRSYPGDLIAQTRDLELEQKFAGMSGKELMGKYVPPCCYSYNAFGFDEAPAASDPPEFFYGGAKRREWTMEPATVAVWPYDAMYDDNVRANGFLDNDQRRANTLEYFEPIESGKDGQSLVFYYANYSNPLSEDDAPKYVLVGVSRIVAVGDEMRYEEVNEQVAERYAGGMVWARNVQAAYPEEGVRLPYHLYRDEPELLAKIALFPEDPVLCKMGSRHLTDDDAIGLLEQFLAKVRELRQIEDRSENWEAREKWLSSQIAGLWRHRGLYPGLLRTLEALGGEALVPGAKDHCVAAGMSAARDLAFEALESGARNAVSHALSEADLKAVKRSWKLMDDDARLLAREVMPRFDLDSETIELILGEDRSEFGIAASLSEIAENPYFLSEQFRGDGPDEVIPWSLVDRGVLPDPDLGGQPLADMTYNDERRFRSLCVDHLRREPNHVFRFATDLLTEILQRMARLPDWKQAAFTERYFVADADFLAHALVVKEEEGRRIVYLKTVWEDERLIEGTVSNLLGRPSITLRRPVTDADWKSWIYRSDSPLARKAAQYDEAVDEQITKCRMLLPNPLSVVTGAAGTGKTTVIEALVRAIRKTEGEGASVLVLAPTGKAADRVREVLDDAGLKSVEVRTVHSFLAEGGWLNDNFTFKRAGGKEREVETLIVDEASMLDLELAACMFRSIDWNFVRRFILVGDPGQLPPIGRGRMFADVIGWLKAERPESLGKLEINVRQMLTRALGRGESIVELSKLFIARNSSRITPADLSDVSDDGATSIVAEELVQKLHAGGKIDEDLDVVYWDDPAQLADLVIAEMERAMGAAPDDDRRPDQIWKAALGDDPTTFQILTPHRGELHGLESLNAACQERLASRVIDRVGSVDGITLFDKVIQFRNRPKSNPLWAFNWTTRDNCKVEVFNGEIGITEPLGFESREVYRKLKTGYGARLKRFGVKFTRKPLMTVGYGKGVPQKNRKGEPVYRTEKVDENPELAYAISIHKAQGSEFANTFVIVPARGARPLSTELVYTALTRASEHCTLLIERDVGTLLEARRRENARTGQINSTLFGFHAAPQELTSRAGWYESGKIHKALSGDMVRSKSEVIIANLLHSHRVPFYYEQLLIAPDGTMKLPDFTLTSAGETWYLEHLGLLEQQKYADKWEEKRQWYEKWYPGRLIITEEAPDLSHRAEALISKLSEGTMTAS